MVEGEKILDEKDLDRLASKQVLARAYLDSQRIEEAIELQSQPKTRGRPDFLDYVSEHRPGCSGCSWCGCCSAQRERSEMGFTLEVLQEAANSH